MDKKYLKLNIVDSFFLALNNVASSLGMVVTMRFKEKHSIEEIKNATRHLVTLYPKLRSVLEPTFFSYRFKILDDDSRVTVLFNDSFKVRHGVEYNSKEYFRCRRSLLNEPFALEQRLPVKFTYLPDDPRPVLFIVVHHIAGDGMALVHMMNSMLAHMNGKKTINELSVGSSAKPHLFEKPFYKIPQQILRSFKLLIADKKMIKNDKIIQVESKHADYFGSADIYQNKLSRTLAELKIKSNELSCSITVLLLAALAKSMGKHSAKSKGDMIGIRISMDLRPFYNKKPPVFGNYVRAFMIRVNMADIKNPVKVIADIKTQLIEFKRRVVNKDLIAHWVIDKLFLAVGNKIFSRGVRSIKKKGPFQLTCHQSNLGNLERLNFHGDKAQLCEAIAVVQLTGFFMTISSIDGEITTSFSYPEAEFTREDVIEIVENFNKNLDVILAI